MKKSKIKKYSIASKRKEQRYFSEAARKAIVEQIEDGLSKSEASRKYEVSVTAIYKWLRKYSASYSPTLKKVVEHQSDSEKNKILQAKLKETYELMGQLQAKNMLLEKVIDLANEAYQTDLKKTFASKPSRTVHKPTNQER